MGRHHQNLVTSKHTGMYLRVTSVNIRSEECTQQCILTLVSVNVGMYIPTHVHIHVHSYTGMYLRVTSVNIRSAMRPMLASCVLAVRCLLAASLMRVSCCVCMHASIVLACVLAVRCLLACRLAHRSPCGICVQGMFRTWGLRFRV